MTVIINAGALYVQDNERRRRKRGMVRAQQTPVGQTWGAQLSTPTVPWAVSPAHCHAQPSLPACLPAQEPFSPTSAQLHFRTAVSQEKGAVKASWLGLLGVSAKYFNVQQTHL